MIAIPEKLPTSEIEGYQNRRGNSQLSFRR